MRRKYCFPAKFWSFYDYWIVRKLRNRSNAGIQELQAYQLKITSFFYRFGGVFKVAVFAKDSA